MENKPPIGLKPKWLHDKERTNEILSAIDRYENAGIRIPYLWIKELDGLGYYDPVHLYCYGSAEGNAKHFPNEKKDKSFVDILIATANNDTPAAEWKRIRYLSEELELDRKRRINETSKTSD